MVSNLIDVECKFSADMLRLALGIANDWPVLLASFGNSIGTADIDCL